MIILRKNIGEQELLSISASSQAGNGTLHITDKAIIYEINHKGIYLNFIPNDAIQKFQVISSSVFGSKKFKLTWQEQNVPHSFEFRVKNSKGLEKIIKENFTNSLS